MSARLMLSLVNDMLDFSSILSGQFKKKLGRFDVRAALNEAADLVRFMIEEKGLRLLVHTEQLISRFIFSDKDRLTQVVVNLLNNACKYTLEGRITLRAWMGLCRGRQTLEVSVQDTGFRIKEEE